MVDIGGVDLLSGGPGGPPQPWTVRGYTATYEGCVMVPSGVAGGNTGPGTINANDIYIQGTRLEVTLGHYLPLTGGTLTGPLNISDPSHLNIGGGLSGNVLASNGLGGTYWTNVPPGGPFLKLSGGVMTGLLTIPGINLLSISGGNLGQIIRTDGQGNLTWINQGGGNLPQPTPPQMGFVLATDGATTPYWTNVLPGGPFLTIANAASTYLPLAGGALTGPLTTNSTITLAADPTAALQVPTKQYVDNTTVTLSGDTMTGPLILNADPVVALGAVTKQYVDNKSAGNNRLINGDMWVNQRAVATAVAGAASVYTLDRWLCAASVASKGSWSQNDNGIGAVPFKYSLGFVSSSAYVSLASDYFEFMQYIEADMITDFMWGSAAAQPITLSFYMYSNQSGTFTGSIRNAASTRSYVFSWPFVTTGGWQRIVINIPGDAVGTWVMAGNAASFNLTFCLGAGSTYLTAFTGTWIAGNFLGVIGSVNIPSINAANFYVTGVKIEKGNVASPYHSETLDKKLADCQRYFQTYSNVLIGGYQAAGGLVYIPTMFPVQMRANPTVAYGTINYSNASALTAGLISATLIRWQVAITAAGYGYGQAPLTLTAEL
jgi:hypothetical protein